MDFFFQINNIQPHIIHYEDVLEDSQSVCEKFVDFVEIETNFTFNIDTSKFNRQNNQINLEWENRYRSERGILFG